MKRQQGYGQPASHAVANPTVKDPGKERTDDDAAQRRGTPRIDGVRSEVKEAEARDECESEAIERCAEMSRIARGAKKTWPQEQGGHGGSEGGDGAAHPSEALAAGTMRSAAWRAPTMFRATGPISNSARGPLT